MGWLCPRRLLPGGLPHRALRTPLLAELIFQPPLWMHRGDLADDAKDRVGPG